MNPAPRLHIGIAQDDAQTLNRPKHCLGYHHPELLFNTTTCEPYEQRAIYCVSKASCPSLQTVTPITREEMNLVDAMSVPRQHSSVCTARNVSPEYSLATMNENHLSSQINIRNSPKTRPYSPTLSPEHTNGSEKQYTVIHEDQNRQTPLRAKSTRKEVEMRDFPVKQDTFVPNHPSEEPDADVVDYQAIQYRQYLSALIAAGYD